MTPLSPPHQQADIALQARVGPKVLKAGPRHLPLLTNCVAQAVGLASR